MSIKANFTKNTLKEIIWSEFRLERNLHDTSYCLQQYLYEVFPVQSFEQCNFSKQIFFKKSNSVLSWTCNWGGLTNLLSIFVFLIYLFIRLNVSVSITMIYKWSKIRVWYAFWLNVNETQPWKFVEKNRIPIFLDFALFY